MRIDVKLTARLLNADKCREGEVAETDVVFPTTKAAIQEALKAVGVDGIRCRNVFLIEHDKMCIRDRRYSMRLKYYLRKYIK